MELVKEILQHKNKMISEFNNMDKLPIIEYEYEDGEFDTYNLFVTPYGIQARNTDILIEWDYVFTLDEHLQETCQQIADSYI